MGTRSSRLAASFCLLLATSCSVLFGVDDIVGNAATDASVPEVSGALADADAAADGFTSTTADDGATPV